VQRHLRFLQMKVLFVGCYHTQCTSFALQPLIANSDTREPT
jgi:hypothetical protein